MPSLMDRLAAMWLHERLGWVEALVAAILTPVVMLTSLRNSVAVLAGVTMWTWVRGAVNSAISARAGRRLDPEDPL